jgi:TonB family protein
MGARRQVSGYFSLVALFAALVGPATPAGAWQPRGVGRWQADWGDRYCTLLRRSERAPYPIFALQTTPGSGWFDLRIVSESWPDGAGSDPSRLTVSPQPGGAALSGRARFERTPRGLSLAIYGLDQDVVDGWLAMQSMTVARDGGTLFDIPLPGLREALAALRECELTVMREWGFDAAAFAALRRPPRTNMAAVLSNADYPREAMGRNESGAVVIRLMVESDGRISDCSVVLSSGHPQLDDRGCSVALRRARGYPAIGPDGNPVASPMTAGIRWVLPQ